MAGTERIETLISKEALAQFEQLKKLSDENVASFEKLIAKAVDLNKQLGNAKTFKQVVDGTKELEQTEEKLIDTQDALTKAQERLKKANHELGDSFDKLAAKGNSKFAGTTEDAFEKLVKLTEELKRNKKAQQDLATAKGAFDQMDKTLPGVQAGIDKITKEQAELIAQEKLLKLNISDTNKEIKNRLKLEIVTPGTRDAVRTTINSLKELRDTKIDINTDEGRAKIADLNKEIDRLSKIMEQTTDKLEKRKINIGNYPGAVRVLEQALQDVNKKIDDFTQSGNENQAMLQSLTKEQELLQTLVNSQTEGFKNATAAIKGNEQAIQLLTQVYGEDSEVVAQLIAETGKLKDEVGDLRAKIKAQASDTKVFDGLIDAAQTLAGIYGIAQGAAALFGDENEELQKTFVKLQAVMTILSGLQGIQNALQKESAVRILITNGLQKVKLLQTKLETAAESKNIIVKYAAIAAQKALNLVTSAAGGPILLLIGLLATALVSMAAYGDGAEDAAKKNERLNKSLERTNKAIDESDKIIKSKGERTLAQLQDQFASEEDLRFQKEQNTVAEIENLKKFNEIDRKNREDAIKNVERLTSGKVKQDKEAIAEAIKVRDGYLDNLQRVTDKENELEVLRLQNSRSAKEEVIKAKQDEIEAQKSALQTSLQLQQSIAGNERKTQDERINALRQSARLQAQIINSEANSKLLNPTLTPSEIKSIEAQRTAALTQARRESNKAIEDLNRSYAERERKARLDIIKTEIEDQIRANDLIASDETKSFDKRTSALYAAYQKRRDIVIAQHEFDIQNDKLTADERTAIETKYLSDINNLTIDYGLQQREIYKQNQDAVNTIIEKGQQGRFDQISTGQANELIELYKQLRAGNISIEEFNRQRVSIEDKYRVITLKQEVDYATAKVFATKEGTAERFAAEKELAEKTLALNDEVTKKQIAAQERLAELKKELAQESVEAFISIVNSGFDSEKQKIDEQIEALEKKKEMDIAVANSQAITQQEKEEQIALIEARAQSQREALERRQRSIDLQRARFEKAVTIGRIIADTAAAVVAALGARPYTPANIAQAVLVGSIGAIQLAKAIATPLPKFATGTYDAPGGLAWVGDAYKSELMVTPQGELVKTPAVPTVMNVPKHSIIFPDAEQSIAAMKAGIAMNNAAPVLVDHGRYYREMTTTLSGDIKHLERTIKSKREIHLHRSKDGWHTITKSGGNQTNYLNENTQL